MKKYIWIASIWLGVILTSITCLSKVELTYEIHFDATTKNSYEVKEEIQTIYGKLVGGVHKESYILMVLHNLDEFEYQEDIKAEWKDNQLVITQGNGQGDKIKGELVANSICMPKVEPRSLFEELFG